ncbi:MAG: DUF481 domain-containing protein [Ignavibacteriaceae bacterium]|jgi:hypothetical protein|nr:DUF481 domain-containing protein [Ignavibacteriaceae bacterium]
MRKSRNIFIAVFIFGQLIYAQLTESDTSNFNWKLSTNGSWLTGNVERLLILNSADFTVIEQPWAIRSSTTYQYGTINKKLTENDLFSRNFFYLFPKNEIYPYLMGWIESNKRRNFSFRYQIGPGVSWGFINNKSSLIKISFTTTYEMTNHRNSAYSDEKYNGESTIDLLRGTVRFFGKHKLFENKINIAYEAWGQQAFDDKENIRFYGNIVLEFPLTQLLSFRTGYNYYYESVVLSGVKPRDGFLFFGISIGENK